MKVRSLAAGTLAFALIGAVAHAQAPPAAQEVEMACKADVAKLCPNVPPGGGQVMQCLKAQKSQVSFGCKRAIYRAKQAKAAEAAAPGAPH